LESDAETIFPLSNSVDDALMLNEFDENENSNASGSIICNHLFKNNLMIIILKFYFICKLKI